MYDLNELQAKHLKDILKIKAEAAKTNKIGLRNQEIESELREQIEKLTDHLEQSKLEIKRLNEEMSIKEQQFKESILQFKKRETIAMQQRGRIMRRTNEMMESSESETSIEEPKPKNVNKKAFKRNKKVNRNDMLNLPSSDSENI